MRTKSRVIKRPPVVDGDFSTIGGIPFGPHWSEAGVNETLKDYRASYYLNACLDAIVEAVGSVPLIVYERNQESNTWEPSPLHPMQDLLDYPNPFITRRQLMERIAGHVVLSGNALWYKLKMNNVTVELWPLNPDITSIVPSQKKFIEKYEYGNGKDKKTYTPDKIVHFTRTNFNSVYWGEGNFKVGRRLFDLDNSTMDWNKAMLERRGVISGVLGVKGRLTKEQYDYLRNQAALRRLGGDKAGEDLIVGSDVTYQRIGSTSQEMDYVATRKLTRQDISMLLRVPLPMVSIYDDATLANVENARKIFWLDRIIPFLERIQEGINLSITPEFGDRRDLWAGFDIDKIPAIMDQRFQVTKTANVLISKGFAPRAVNRELGMNFKDEDIIEGFIVGNTVVGSEVGQLAAVREQEPKPSDLTNDNSDTGRDGSSGTDRALNSERLAPLTKAIQQLYRLEAKAGDDSQLMSGVFEKWFELFEMAFGSKKAAHTFWVAFAAESTQSKKSIKSRFDYDVYFSNRIANASKLAETLVETAKNSKKSVKSEEKHRKTPQKVRRNTVKPRKTT